MGDQAVNHPRMDSLAVSENRHVEPLYVDSPSNGSINAGSYDDDRLGTIDVACLIINKMIGGGVFVSAPTVLLLAGNKLGALALWIVGGLISFISIVVYLEYGLAWPYNGGEFYYIAKVFPVPPLVFASSFAWAFVAFSTSTSNAFNFAIFANYPEMDNPNEWKSKFIACVMIVAVAALHYRKVNLGIWVNNGLAFYKVTFLSILTFAGFAASCRDGARGQLQGLGDFVTTHEGSEVTATNVVFAFLLVLFSYDGWENANYVTSEIKGNDEERKRILKKGALIAVSLVTALYILYSFFLYLLLDFETLTQGALRAVTIEFVKKAFNSTNTGTTTAAVGVCVALAALGNMVGVFFTNGRVKRDIAKSRLIPFYRYFEISSMYGRREWDGLGTPTGGLVLHALVTCITIAATPFYPDGNTEGITFITDIYTYSHAITHLLLASGLLFLRKRMTQYQTHQADPPDRTYNVPWNYTVMKSAWLRCVAIIVFFVVNGLVITMPFDPSKNPDGSTRHIPTWILPAIVLPIYAGGALTAMYLLCVIPSKDMYFEQTKGSSVMEFVNYSRRRWIIQYPTVRDVQDLGRYFTLLGWGEIKKRFRDNGEERTASEVRKRFSGDDGTNF